VRFQEWELFGDAVLPVCSPEFLRRHENWLVHRSLNKVPLVHLENRTPDPDWPDWRAWALRFGFEFDRRAPGLRLSQVGSGIQAALAGQGLVLCGLVEAHDAIQQGALVIPFDRALCYPTGFHYRLVTPQGRRLSQVQRDFRDWVLDTAAAFREQLALGPSA
jgi:LysR family glycine cleavage system transcriptional activator